MLHNRHCHAPNPTLARWPVAPLAAAKVLVWDTDTRCSVCEGLSPKIFRYSTEKRPSSTKPKHIATAVTVVSSQSADKRARLASDNRNIRRRRHGGRPQVLWNALRRVRSLTARARHRAETWSGSSKSARASFSACSTRSRQGLLSWREGIF